MGIPKEVRKEEIIHPISLEIDRLTWEIFKDKVPRSIKLNDMLVRLIEAYNKTGDKKDGLDKSY